MSFDLVMVGLTALAVGFTTGYFYKTRELEGTKK